MPLPSLVPRDRVFFDLFNEAGQNTLRAARMPREMLENEGDRLYRDAVAALPPTSSRAS